MVKQFLFFTILLLLSTLSLSSLGALLESAHTRNQGGAARALVDSVDSLYVNAASLSHIRDRSISTNLQKDKSSLIFYESARTNRFSGGLGFLSNNLDQSAKLETVSFGLAVLHPDFRSGKPMDQWSFGLTGHHHILKSEGNQMTQNSLDLGLLFTPRPFFGVGLAVYNAGGQPFEGFPNLLDINQVGLGINFIYTPSLQFRMDLLSGSHYSAQGSTLSFGFETIRSHWMSAGLGLAHRFADSRTVPTGGVGFLGPKFQIQYSYESAQKTSDEPAHSVDLTIPF